MRILLLFLLFGPALLHAQSKKQRKALEARQKADQLVVNNIRSHVQHFGNNKNGGSSDSNSDDQAKDYIISQFQQAGLQPKGTAGYTQPFTIEDGKQIAPETYLKVNGTELTVLKDYFPLPYSANKSAAGMPAMSLRERGVPWFADVKEWLDENLKNPAFNWNEAVKKEAARAAMKGATALFLYNSGSQPDSLRFDSKDKSAASAIPLIYIMPDGYKKSFTDHADLLDIELNVAIKERNIQASNIVGYIDNSAATTVIISAGYGSILQQNENASGEQVQGSVDNMRSGAAMLIEAAKMLSASKAKNNNYLFIAFHGEDASFAGSRYWINHSAVTAPVNYIINLNCAALKDTATKITIKGYKTSPVWPQVLAAVDDKNAGVSIDSMNDGNISATQFYDKEIPVLNFYTINAEDGGYNYETDMKVAKLVYQLVEVTNDRSRISFSKPIESIPANKTIETTMPETKPAEKSLHTAANIASVKAAVSLGIMADNSNNAWGLRINGVSPKKLAAKIGLQAGDILMNLGSHKIEDMRTYLQALANFKPGDKTVLLVKRGKEDKEFAIEF